ncbi:hypothetical protein IP86_17290 [Rhodopseudomonas sp. AAP120]|uniref:DUF2933 domain-containing protein n=1 Tax=Rhodopseudomonas TaxID=1073 RepID=UPI000164BE1B|nr:MULTISPECIES: DUF2933 domain-containing protein [Rhodopseudomonas]ACE99623.1 conserved hypothetical protein [Rhodopseudomonas palustris TIE-1]KPF96232.1 hypothetical protein IP86_17290 [Rhodopseudomonas sp. AAP120]
MVNHDGQVAGQSKKSFWISAPFLIALAIGGIALIALWPKHQGHIAIVLPYLILLACPLMHLFHHHGHGKHGEPRAPEKRSP